MARRFQFRLQTLLRVRELREREAKRKVGLKQAEIARLDQLDRQAAEQISAHQQVLREQQSRARLAPVELSREQAWIAYLHHTIVERQAIRAGLVSELEALRNEWHAARRRKRMVETLRDRRWDEYTKNHARREQAESDELARALHVSVRVVHTDSCSLT